jgi:Family of unknown function (DUF6236)
VNLADPGRFEPKPREMLTEILIVVLASALYYPYINVQDSAWLKAAALYYSSLLRMVPRAFVPHDDPTARALIDECGFIENIDGSLEAETISMEYVHEMRQNSSWPEDLPSIFRRRRDFRSIHRPARIHVGKFTFPTLGALAEMGLAEDYRTLGRGQVWIKVEPRAASIYMTMLAERMSERRGICTVTDDPLFQQWIRYFAFEPGKEQQRGREFRIPHLVIKAAVPRGVKNVPVRRIVEFRRRHEAERIRFFDAVQSMSTDLAAVKEQNALDACVRQHEAVVADSVKQLKRALRGLRIETAAGLLAVSLPPMLAQIVQAPSAALIAGGISIAAGIKSIGYWHQYARLRDGNPWSYVLSLSKLGARSFLESAAEGDLFI